MKVALRFVARRVTPDNTCSSMVLLQLQTSAAWTEVVALLWWHPGTVLTSLDLLLILDISRGATPIVVLCENLSIDQLKFCVSCLVATGIEPTGICEGLVLSDMRSQLTSSDAMCLQLPCT